MINISYSIDFISLNIYNNTNVILLSYLKNGGIMEKIVELKNVSKVYKIGENEFKALDNIDLSLNKGEMIVILGPSGAGKSTLLNLIGGMDTPTNGSVIIDGENISKYNENKLSDYRAENVGFIFQFYNILPSLTVKENVDIVKDIVKNRGKHRRSIKRCWTFRA